jgi:hypothetical protein
MKACILTEQPLRERGDQRGRRMAKREMARDQAAGLIDLPLAIERVQESRADVLDCVGKVVEPVAGLAWEPRRRHVEVAGEIDRHRPVEHPPHRVDRTGVPALLRPDPFQRLVNGVGIGEGMEGRFPVGMLVGGAETRDAERGHIREGAAEIGGGCARDNRRLERLHDRPCIIAKEGGGKLRMIRPGFGPAGSREKLAEFRSACLAPSDKVHRMAPSCRFLRPSRGHHLTDHARQHG